MFTSLGWVQFIPKWKKCNQVWPKNCVKPKAIHKYKFFSLKQTTYVKIGQLQVSQTSTQTTMPKHLLKQVLKQ